MNENLECTAEGVVDVNAYVPVEYEELVALIHAAAELNVILMAVEKFGYSSFHLDDILAVIMELHTPQEETAAEDGGDGDNA